MRRHASQLLPGFTIEGHLFGRRFMGRIEALFSLPALSLVEIHVNLPAAVEINGLSLQSFALWVNEDGRMISQDGRAELAAITEWRA